MTLETWIESRRSALERAIAAGDRRTKNNNAVRDMLLMLRMIEAALNEFGGMMNRFRVRAAMQFVLDESEKGTSDV